MDYEIEFHPVGDASRAGDAITIRYGLNGEYNVMVVDGGTSDSGATLVEHIKNYYGEDTIISDIVSSHPDSDHVSGLRELIKSFPVRRLWMHGLWDHAGELLPYLADRRWTEPGLAASIRENYPIIDELRVLAAEQGTIIAEPFAGQAIGPFTVLSPTRWAYQRLVAQFRKTPEPDRDALESEGMWLEPNTRLTGILGGLQRAVEAARNWIGEHWDIELLREGAVTAAENETSTVLFARFGHDGVLLTADAGINALHWSIDFAEANGIDLSPLALLQVPHHGSRSNVTPSLLDRLIGSKQPRGSATHISGVVSCPKDDESHPRKVVMNAFRRRGVAVHKTQGIYFRKFSPGMPFRYGEIAAVPFGWFDQVEDYD